MRFFTFIISLLFISFQINAQSVNIKKVAIEGYDVVAYHQGKALQGTSALNVNIDDIYYHFSSYENKLLFEQNPKKYLPKFGGFCAIGIAIYDGKYDIDPEDFLIDDGALYLFCPDQLENWKADKENLKIKAEIEWKKMENASIKN